MEALLTVKEAARLTGAHPQTLYDAISQGRLPSLKIGAARMIDPRDLAVWNRTRGRWPKKDGK